MLPEFLGIGGTLDDAIDVLSENGPFSEELEEPNALQDMESLAFFLWMNEEVDKEQARRQAEQQKTPD